MSLLHMSLFCVNLSSVSQERSSIMSSSYLKRHSMFFVFRHLLLSSSSVLYYEQLRASGVITYQIKRPRRIGGALF